MSRTLLVCLCTVLCTSYVRPMYGAEPPGEQITIPGRKAPEPAVLSNAITVAAGRFIPLCPPDGVPSYLAQSPAWRVYSLKAGDKFVGVQYDAADGAEQETYTWTTPVYVLLTRPLAGTYSLQFLKNGPADVGPVVNGAPLTLTVQGPRPPPVPPTPPVPPDPKPVVSQLRVLFVYDGSKVLPPEQQSIRTSQVLRDYLSTHAVKAAGGTPEVRFADANADLSKESDAWKAIMSRPRASLPWIVIDNGSVGYEGPLPASVADTLTLLKKYGGN